MTDTASIGIALTDLEVSVLKTPCSVLTGTLASFTCTLPTNADSTPQLPAGTGKVMVHTKQVGYADNTAASDETITLTVTSVTPTKSSPGGLIPVSIIGTGFPLEKDDSIALTICGNNV